MRGEVSVVWPSDDQGVDLAPVLIISSKSKRLPPTIIWRISTKEDMSPIVLSVPTTDHNLSFQVPELVLDTDTQYFWQAKIYDENGQLIDRTEVAPFLTILYSQSDDKDSDISKEPIIFVNGTRYDKEKRKLIQRQLQMQYP